METFFQQVLASSIVVIVLILFVFVFYLIVSNRSLKYRRTQVRELTESIKVGKTVLCSGGIKGRIVGIGEEFLSVEIAKDTIIEILREGIIEVLK